MGLKNKQELREHFLLSGFFIDSGLRILVLFLNHTAHAIQSVVSFANFLSREKADLGFNILL